MDENVEVPFIRGSPFLQTSKALIDMDGGKMTLQIGEEKLTYHLTQATRHSLDFDDAYYFLDVTNGLVNDHMQEMIYPNPLEGCPKEKAEKESEKMEKESISSHHQEY